MPRAARKGTRSIGLLSPEFIVFESTTREGELREANWDENLRRAYEVGATLFPTR